MRARNRAIVVKAMSDALEFIEYLEKNRSKLATMSAMFDVNGKRLDGDKEIEVEVIPVNGVPNAWFYRAKPLKGYVFVPFPVTPCHVDYGTLDGQTNPSADIFRFLPSSVMALTDDKRNLAVNFTLIGYKPGEFRSKLEKG